MSLLNARIVFIKKIQYYVSQHHNRLFAISSIKQSNKKPENNEELLDDDKPIRFSTSNAAKWRAHISRSGTKENSPWFQSYVVSLSLAIFMIYFFILREENDVDREFEKTLYQRIGGLEESQLELSLNYNLEHNLPTDDIKRRLAEIRKEET